MVGSAAISGHEKDLFIGITVGSVLLLLFMLMIRSVLCFVWAENIMRKGK